jgi:hypothetical protein
MSFRRRPELSKALSPEVILINFVVNGFQVKTGMTSILKDILFG